MSCSPRSSGGKPTKRRDGSPAYRQAVAANLVRVGIFYGGGRADYQYRPRARPGLANFTLIRLEGRYHVLAYHRCPEALP